MTTPQAIEIGLVLGGLSCLVLSAVCGLWLLGEAFAWVWGWLW